MYLHRVVDRKLLPTLFARVFPVTVLHRDMMAECAVNLERSIALFTLVF